MREPGHRVTIDLEAADYSALKDLTGRLAALSGDPVLHAPRCGGRFFASPLKTPHSTPLWPRDYVPSLTASGSRAQVSGPIGP